jgi:pimeloyl-ACP methyl ester carboxylesterase
MRVPLSPKHRQYLDAAEKQSFLSTEHVSIQTYKWGNGPNRILFLHGWQSHSYRWKKYIDSFDKSKFSVYAMDAPAHGQSGGRLLSVPSYSDAVAQFIERVGGFDTVVGHSMGCFSALYTFHRVPYMTPKKLILLASPGEAQEFFEHYRTLLSLSERTSKLVLSEFERVFQKTPEEFSAPLFARGLDIPGLLIHDEEDKDTEVEHSKRIHASWKNSKLIVTKGLGHNLRSEAIVSKVVAFASDRAEQGHTVSQ